MVAPSPPITADSGTVTADTGLYDASGGIIPYARVQALQRGFYGAVWRDVGDIFDILLSTDFSDSAVSIVPPSNADYPIFGWMVKVNSAAPLVSYALSNQGASTPVQGIYGVDSAGHKVLSIPRYVV